MKAKPPGPLGKQTRHLGVVRYGRYREEGGVEAGRDPRAVRAASLRVPRTSVPIERLLEIAGLKSEEQVLLIAKELTQKDVRWLEAYLEASSVYDEDLKASERLERAHGYGRFVYEEPPSGWTTVARAARRARVSSDRILQRIKKGQIKATKQKSKLSITAERWIIREVDLEGFLERAASDPKLRLRRYPTCRRTRT